MVKKKHPHKRAILALSEKVVELKRWISILFDAAVDQGNGESLLPNDDLEDARESFCARTF